jgi:hypothetical protein
MKGLKIEYGLCSLYVWSLTFPPYVMLLKTFTFLMNGYYINYEMFI